MLVVKRSPVSPTSATYLVQEKYNIGGCNNEIPEGYILRVCENGWYQVFTPDNNMHFFSVSPEVFVLIYLGIFLYTLYYVIKNLIS